MSKEVATPEYLYKVEKLAERNSTVKTLIHGANGYENLSDKFKTLIANLLKEEEAKDAERQSLDPY